MRAHGRLATAQQVPVKKEAPQRGAEPGRGTGRGRAAREDSVRWDRESQLAERAYKFLQVRGLSAANKPHVIRKIRVFQEPTPGKLAICADDILYYVPNRNRATVSVK